MVITIAIILAAYLIGSIPTGYLIARLKGVSDIRTLGSGNIGATNVGRFLGAHYFFLVFLLDAFKAFIFLYVLMYWYAPSYYLVYLSALALAYGNGASVFLKHKGGKGVATSFGILSVLSPCSVVAAFLLWLCIVVYTRTIGKASVIVLLTTPLISYLYNTPGELTIVISLICLWALYLHRENIMSYVF